MRIMQSQFLFLKTYEIEEKNISKQIVVVIIFIYEVKSSTWMGKNELCATNGSFRSIVELAL